MGIIRLADVAAFSNPANRILADLVSEVQPLVVLEDEAASAVAKLFRRLRIHEAVVQTRGGAFVGLITAESVLEWLWAAAEAGLVERLVREDEPPPGGGTGWSEISRPNRPQEAVPGA